MARRTPDSLDCASAQWIGKRREQELSLIHISEPTRH